MTRGEIWWVDFGTPFGSEHGFMRPALIIQNDSFNETNMNTTIVVPLTTNLRLAEFPGNMILPSEETKLSKDSVAVTPQISVIDKNRLIKKVAKLESSIMLKYGENLKLILEL